jgi:hypothetical protein
MPSQQSATVQLQAGTRYYVEALHKQSWGNGYLAVAWRLPDGVRQEPIPGTSLIPFSTTLAPTTAPAPAPAPSPTPTACAGTGSLQREQWDNVTGTTIGSVPTWSAPSSSAAISSFEAPASSASNYGARVRGYICPPTSGAYTFWIVGDDAAELFLSTDADPAKKVRIATCAGWTSGNRDFTRMPSQQSATVQLVAGTRYYVEALHKQSWGNGYLAVAWRLPDGTRQEPIPGSSLIPFSTTAALTSGATLSDATALEAASTALPTRSTVTVYPNPVTGRDARATVEVRLAKTAPVSLSLYNLQGQLLRKLFVGTLEAGQVHHVPLETSGLSDGLHFVRLITPTEVLNIKVMHTK